MIGRDSLNPDDTSREITFIQTRLNRVLTEDDYELDLALLEAYPPVVDEVYPQKPRFVLPPRTDGSAEIDVLIGGWGKMENNGNPRFRQLQFFNDREVFRLNEVTDVLDLQHLWFIELDDPYNGPDSGDSGGALLWRYDPEDDNKWDVLGGLAQRSVDEQYGAWADIIWSANRQWLEDAAEVGSNVPGRWLGETDYTGPCLTDQDPDCDRYFDRKGNDNCPGIYNPMQNFWNDSDSDGVADYCDNCILDANYDQRNGDGDGFGDACDRCPGIDTTAECGAECSVCIQYVDSINPPPDDCFDPTNNDCFTFRCARDFDGDGDRVGNVCDNCPGAANTDQANCNEDAELARGFTELGDACDDAPCAHVTTGHTQLKGPLATIACNSPTLGGTCPVSVAAAIEWRGVVAGAPEGVDGATRFAHCNCDRAAGTPAQRVANCQGTALGDPNCAIGAANVFPTPGSTPPPSGWRASTTTTPRPLRGTPAAPSGRLVPIPLRDLGKADLIYDPGTATGVLGAEHPTADYAVRGSPMQGTRWLFDRDLAAFGVTFTPPSGGVRLHTELTQLARDMRGIGWAFTSSYTGASLTGALRDRASSYFKQDLEPRGVFDGPALPPIIVAPPKGIGGSDPCINCPTTLPPWIWRTNDPGLLGPGEMISVRPRAPSWTTPGFAGLDDLFGQVGNGVTFTPAAESSGVLTTLGTAERGAFYSVGSGAVTSLREGLNGEFTGNRLTFESLSPAASDIATFSGGRGELYLLRNVSGGPAQLTVVDTVEEVTSQVTLTGVERGVPLSMTYRTEDEALYVADRTDSGALRILRVSRTGAAQELGRINNPGTLRTVVHLAADSRGALLLTASGGLADNPLYLVLVPGATDVHVSGYLFDTRPGRLLVPPVASRDAYAVAKTSLGMPLVLSEFTKADFTPLAQVSLASVASLFQTRSGDDVCPFPTQSVDNDCAQVRGLALYASRQLTIADRATTRNGTVYSSVANGGSTETNIGVEAQVGNLFSKSPVTIRDRGRVNGFARSGGAITLQAGSTVSGTRRQNSAVNIVPLSQFSLEFPQLNAGNISLEPPPSQPSSMSLEPGAYGDAMVKSRATLALRSGVYSFVSLAFEPDAVASLDTRQGPIFVYVQGVFRFRGRIVNQGPRADVLVAVFGTETVFLEAPFIGTVVAPNAGITLATVSAGHIGSFFAKDIELRAQTNVTHESFNYPWVP
jgi:hypothetical protein